MGGSQFDQDTLNGEEDQNAIENDFDMIVELLEGKFAEKIGFSS